MGDVKTPVVGGKVVRLAALIRSAIKAREQRTAPVVKAFEESTSRAATVAAAEDLRAAAEAADAEYDRDVDTAIAHVGEFDDERRAA